MNEIFEILMVTIIISFMIVVCVVIALIAIYVIKSNKKKNEEKKAYETMLLSPNNTTVSQYIQKFLSSSNRILEVSVGESKSTNSEQENMQDKLRQAQGYKIVMESPNVSDQVKEQLRKTFIAKGVPIIVAV